MDTKEEINGAIKQKLFLQKFGNNFVVCMYKTFIVK